MANLLEYYERVEGQKESGLSNPFLRFTPLSPLNYNTRDTRGILFAPSTTLSLVSSPARTWLPPLNKGVDPVVNIRLGDFKLPKLTFSIGTVIYGQNGVNQTGMPRIKKEVQRMSSYITSGLCYVSSIRGFTGLSSRTIDDVSELNTF